MPNNGIALNPVFAHRARIAQISLRYQRQLNLQKQMAAKQLAAEQKAYGLELIDGERREIIIQEMADLMLARTRRGRSTNYKTLEGLFTSRQIEQCSAAAVEAALRSKVGL